MKKIKRIDSVKDFNDYIKIHTSDQLISLVEFNTCAQVSLTNFYMGVYAIFLNSIKCGGLVYGPRNYNHKEAILVFISPGQIYSIDSSKKSFDMPVYGIIFHPDYIRGTQLSKNIENYQFDENEVLHLYENEKLIIDDFLQKISLLTTEFCTDNYSKALVVLKIEILLIYCQRFSNHQFIKKNYIDKDIITRFEILLEEYFSADKNSQLGLPTVEYCAENLHLSPNYFGELIKHETGSNALNYIHAKIINEAKIKILDPSKNFSEISDELGFKSQQQFTRLFKKETGFTPTEYRNMS